MIDNVRYADIREAILTDIFSPETASVLESFQCGDLPNSTSIIHTLLWRVYQFQHKRATQAELSEIFSEVEAEIDAYIQHNFEFAEN